MATFNRPLIVPIYLFQSTPPIRVATDALLPALAREVISIHATHTGGDLFQLRPLSCTRISIHATHTGGDGGDDDVVLDGYRFQSTPPIRVATHAPEIVGGVVLISIHATHTGGDLQTSVCGDTEVP